VVLGEALLTRYWLDLFTPLTWRNYLASDRTVTGFRDTQRTQARGIEPGDIFLCYITKISRWSGALLIEEGLFEDDTPIFYEEQDPFIARFKVAPMVALPLERSVPIEQLWEDLSVTRDIPQGAVGWAQRAGFRRSLRELKEADATTVIAALESQTSNPQEFPLTAREQYLVRANVPVRTPTGITEVEVPEEVFPQELTASEQHAGEGEASSPAGEEVRLSLQIQAQLAAIGAKLRFSVWIPPADRGAVTALMPEEHRGAITTNLPLNYDSATMKTVSNIDVIWIKRTSMVRAFEVEHTTSIYSGLLRMADLLALQPNMKISLHIVADEDKRDKVRAQVVRPVFTFLESGPLKEVCSFLSYESVSAILAEKRLHHMSDTIIEEFEEFFDD
jgi:hypothetical protein